MDTQLKPLNPFVDSRPDAWLKSEMQQEVCDTSRRALDRYRYQMVDSLMGRIKDGAQMIADGKSAADAYEMVSLMQQRIEHFDNALRYFQSRLPSAIGDWPIVNSKSVE